MERTVHVLSPQADRGQVKILTMALALLLACSACTTASSEVPDAQEPNEVRISVQDLADPSIDLDLNEVQGIDLGDSAPTSQDWCGGLWRRPEPLVNDAIVPLQFWRDAFDQVTNMPPDVSQHVQPLLSYADQRLDWNFGRAEQPEFTNQLQQNAHQLAILAAQQCADLPVVLGLPGGAAPARWTNGSLTPNAVAQRCEEERARTQLGIDAYRQNYGDQPPTSKYSKQVCTPA